MTDFYSRHSATLAKAVDACDNRYSWTAYPESPSSKIHGEEKPRAGKARFEAMLGKDYPLEQPGEIGRTGAEVSPYTRRAAGYYLSENGCRRALRGGRREVSSMHSCMRVSLFVHMCVCSFVRARTLASCMH